jgi:hypothetical protein
MFPAGWQRFQGVGAARRACAGESMDKWMAKAERLRLQKLLDAYEAGRLNQQAEDERRGLQREATPDRADNIRARIARLDQLLADGD